jgi:hypothetical protein
MTATSWCSASPSGKTRRPLPSALVASYFELITCVVARQAEAPRGSHSRSRRWIETRGIMPLLRNSSATFSPHRRRSRSSGTSTSSRVKPSGLARPKPPTSARQSRRRPRSSSDQQRSFMRCGDHEREAATRRPRLPEGVNTVKGDFLCADRFQRPGPHWRGRAFTVRRVEHNPDVAAS